MLVDIAVRMIESSLYDGSFPTQREVNRLLAVRTAEVRDLPHGDQRLVDAARLMAYSRVNRSDDARDLAEVLAAGWPDPRDDDLSVDVVLSVVVALAEAHLALGNTSGAEEWAVRAEGLVDECTDPRWRYRVFGILATAQAIGGQWALTERILVEQRSLAATQGWDLGRAEYMAATAELFLVFTSFDVERASDLARRVHTLAAVEPTSRPLSHLVDAVVLALRGDVPGSAALALRSAQGIVGKTGPNLVAQFAHHLSAQLLLREREPLRALGQVRDCPVIGNHLLCPHVTRALAALQLEDYRGALAATNECVRPRTRHSLWSLPAIKFCRAVAHFKLRHSLSALREAASAAAINGNGNLAALASVLPPAPVLELLDHLERFAPPSANAYISEMRMLAQNALDDWRAPVILPFFSEREHLVARLLQTSASFPQIAGRLQVSPSTVKSQASAIYGKLGVSGREEAVAILEQAGYYET